MGLCAGLSVVTLCEFLELIMDLIVFGCLKIRRIKPDTVPDPISRDNNSIQLHRPPSTIFFPYRGGIWDSDDRPVYLE